MRVSERDVHSKSHVPVHNLHPADIQLKGERHVYDHFHAPYNEHNYFQESATKADLFFLREFDRLAPYKTQPHSELFGHGECATTCSPTAAPGGHKGQWFEGADPVSPSRAKAPHVPPNDRNTAVYYADLVSGHEVSRADAGWTPKQEPEWASQQWKLAQVMTYKVPEKLRENRPRPFHRDYRHYKYFGFAGQGAKTSWGHNPKYALINETSPEASKEFGFEMPPLEPYLGGPRRCLTKLERKLITQFSDHAFGDKYSQTYKPVLKPDHWASGAHKPLSAFMENLRRA